MLRQYIWLSGLWSEEVCVLLSNSKSRSQVAVMHTYQKQMSFPLKFYAKKTFVYCVTSAVTSGCLKYISFWPIRGKESPCEKIFQLIIVNGYWLFAIFKSVLSEFVRRFFSKEFVRKKILLIPQHFYGRLNKFKIPWLLTFIDKLIVNFGQISGAYRFLREKNHIWNIRYLRLR